MKKIQVNVGQLMEMSFLQDRVIACFTVVQLHDYMAFCMYTSLECLGVPVLAVSC